jgi:hypothetical protein
VPSDPEVASDGRSPAQKMLDADVASRSLGIELTETGLIGLPVRSLGEAGECATVHKSTCFTRNGFLHRTRPLRTGRSADVQSAFPRRGPHGNASGPHDRQERRRYRARRAPIRLCRKAKRVHTDRSVLSRLVVCTVQDAG